MYMLIKVFTLLSLSLSSSIAENNSFNFIQPFMINFDKKYKEQNSSQKQLLIEFKNLAQTEAHSIKFQNLNYKIMQNFQEQYYKTVTKQNKKRRYKLETRNFIQILKSIKQPSFFSLYSQLYLETLAMKDLKDNDIIQLNKLANSRENPYAHLLSYIDNLNKINSILLTDQKNLHKHRVLLLDRLPQEQQTYLLRLTALQLAPLYPKESIELQFNNLFAKNKIIKREQILKVLNFQNPDTFKIYTMKEKKRSFIEEVVFNANMKALKRNDIAMILATLYMQDNNFKEARSYIRQTPRDNLPCKYNPFNSSIATNNKIKFRKTHSMRTFAETMERLEKRIEKESVTARDYYLYGNGLYNKSWFGNFPRSSVFFRDEDIYKDDIIPPTTNLKKATSAYHSALERVKSCDLIKEKKDKFRAEISYQLLKIKFNKALINTNNYTKEINKRPKTIDLLRASRSFAEAIKDYKSDYSHTAYGKNVINNSIIFKYL